MFQRDLNGIDEIREYLKLENDLTVLDWRIGYGLPIRKEGGIWKANKSELKEWRLRHKILKEPVPEPREPTVRVLKVQEGRFGLLKIQK